VGLRAGLDRVENLASTGVLSPDRPARSESLYSLRYPGPHNLFVMHIINETNLLIVYIIHTSKLLARIEAYCLCK
jgi:hypothetical protein